MYKKIINCLKNYGFRVLEYDTKYFEHAGFTIKNAICTCVKRKWIYLEIDETGCICCYGEDGECNFIIGKDVDYIMLFGLGAHIL